MTNDDGRKPEGAPERSPKAGAGAPSGVDGNGPKRFSVQRKMAIVAQLLRGEPLRLNKRSRMSQNRAAVQRRRLFEAARVGPVCSLPVINAPLLLVSIRQMSQILAATAVWGKQGVP